MKLDIVVTLDSGGTVTVRGRNLSAEDVNEVFGILSRHSIGTRIPDQYTDDQVSRS